MSFRIPRISISLKLIFTVIIFALLLVVSSITVFRLSSDKKPRKHFEEFMRKFERNIVSNIGIPPDTLKAKEICDELGIEMRFDSPNMEWASDKKVPNIEDIFIPPHLRTRFDRGEPITVIHNSIPYSIFHYPEGIFIIQPLNPSSFFKPERAVIFMLIAIVIIITLLYLLLRYIFSPLKDLSKAVHQIGDGNYNVKVDTSRKDELGELAGSINTMSAKISNSVKAKEQLLIDVSHELRSPITRIKLGLELDSPKEKIEEDVNEMEKMVSSLLENYRADNTLADLKIDRTELVSLIEDTIAEYSANERIKFEKPNGEINFKCDADKLQIVFRNLIDNALKYSNGDIKISITEQLSEIWITFEDNGIGISDEDLKYIFEPFYRADRSRSRSTGGFGLGLSICKKIVDAHKGEIEIKSKINEGTKIFLKFKTEI